MKNFLWTISDILTLIGRNLRRYTRLPQLIVFSTIQPIMFLLLFTYVFGGAIKGSSAEYINFILPGILIQTALFGSIQTGVGLADDVKRGIIDRFKSLPMSRSAVLMSRIITDSLRNIFVVLLMTTVGYLIGFRFHGNIIEIVDALGLAILFGFAFSWVAATIGLAVKDTETAQVAGFIWVFPLVFASSIFVPTETMPKYLKYFAQISPITVTVNAVRALSNGYESQTYLLESLGWIMGIVIVFMPLAIYFYRRLK